ncbi:LppM family (lipo)protein [Isoptericola cucumis]|uniref:LppM family (lipo)protein n=1 Tax=Isoptericola cucumis TaxID=1776856 RepID=UPI001666E5AB|nr:hypothetical protein [Isoptericola cucumis]
MNTPTRGVRRLRTALAALLAAVGLVALAGCMKVDMDMTLSEDDTVSGSMVMAISNQLAETMGMEPGQLWDQAGGELQQDLPEGATQEPYSDDEYTGSEFTFTDAPIENFSGGGAEDLSITREGDEYVVTGTMDLSEGADQLGSMPDGVKDSFDVRIAVTFPGPVGETNGTVDGNTVVWTPQLGETTEIQARGAAEAGSSFPWWLVGLVVGVLVLALVVVLVVRSRRSGAAATAPQAGPGAGPGAAFGAAPMADPGTTPGSGTGPTAEEQVFGTRPASAPEPTAPPAAAPAPTTGPVPEPLEPGPAPEPTEPGPGQDGGTGPVPEPLEPAEPRPATEPTAPVPPSEPAEPVQPTEPPTRPVEPHDPTRPVDPTTPETPSPETPSPETPERRPTDPPQGA